MNYAQLTHGTAHTQNLLIADALDIDYLNMVRFSLDPGAAKFFEERYLETVTSV
jgi:hypothetical protein